MKSSLSKTTLIFLTSICFWVVCGLVFFILQSLLQKNGAALEAAARSAALEQANYSTSLDLTRLHGETSAERSQLTSHVLTQSTLIDFLTDLELIARQQQLLFQTRAITPSGDESQRFSEVRVNASFSGMQDQVFTMIDIIENLPYHSQIEQAKVSHVGNEWMVDLVVRVTIANYDQ